MDIREYNRTAWNHQVAKGNRWTVPVTAEVIAAARRGEWSILLTPTKSVPRSWFPPLTGCDVLCLASGGGQQAPILAAAGANVTLLDNSPRQLQQDQLVADRERLKVTLLEGDMRELTALCPTQFDLVVHPCSNCFVPEIRSVWKGVYHVLRPGGIVMSGFLNPAYFLFDDALQEQGKLEVRYSLPYSDLTSITEAERQRYVEKGEPLIFGHTLEEQIGGQLEAGLVMTSFFEDKLPEHALSKYLATTLATRSVKPPLAA